MIDPSLIVQSAANSFNNAALSAPDFFWAALLCAPIFVIAWMLAKPIAQIAMPENKYANWRVATLSLVLIPLWVLSRENFYVLRESFSWVSVLCCAVLFLSAMFFAKIELPRAVRRAQKLGAGLIVAATFLCALPDWRVGLAQVLAVVSGYLIGRNMNKKFSPKILASLAMLACTFGMLMQPEFFRFGQLDNLSVIHMLFLIAQMMIVAGYFAMFVKPRGWNVGGHYLKLKTVMRLCAFLTLAMFIITESEIMFAAFFVMELLSVALSVRNMPVDTDMKPVRDDFWIFSIFGFGILSGLHALTAAAIVMFAAYNRGRDGLRQLKHVL